MPLVEKITLMRRVSGALLMSTALLWIVLVDRSQNTSLSTSSVALRALAMVPRRPVVYAFVEENPLIHKNGEQQQHLWWQSVWTAAGWDAKFLTLDDAQRHPDFGIFQSVVGESLPFGHQNEKHRYYRWLAMSLVTPQEGNNVAWLTDTTAVAPLWSANQLPTTTTTTPVDFTVRCAPVPQSHHQQPLETLSSSPSSACIMSGSKKEWERMSIALLDSIQRHHTLAYHNSHHHHQQQHSLGQQQQQQQQRRSDTLVDEETMVPPVWSESLALEEIVSFANPTGRPMARRENGAVTTTTIAIHQHTTTIDCASLDDKIAIFFHPQQLKDKQWLSAWGQQCSGIRYYNDDDMPNPDTIIGQLPRPVMENQRLD